MKTRQRINRSSHHRGGLAMVELVLYLPIMLFVMALMVNFGNIAAWKVRAQGATRYAAWRTLRDRTGQNDPNPDNWPQPATLGNSGGADVNQPNNLWNGNQLLMTPVVRGPVIASQNQGGSVVVPGRFNMHEEVHGGDSHVERKLPLLRSLLPNNGTYAFTQHQVLLDHRWEYRHLQMPQNPYDRRDVSGDVGNEARRAKRWYRLDPPFFGEIQGGLRRLAQADAQLKRNPARADLNPLDRDPEIILIQLRRLLGGNIQELPPPNHPVWRRVGTPDFHGRAQQKCTVDKDRVKSSSVDPYIRYVERLPGTMANYNIQQYRQEIDRLKDLMPPPQQQIDGLEKKIEQLQKFLKSVPRKYGGSG